MSILRFTLGVLIPLLLAHSAQAHLFAPSLLKIVETTPHHYNVVWKTSVNRTSDAPLAPVWPDSL